MNDEEAPGHEATEKHPAPVAAEGPRGAMRQIAFYWSKLSFLLFVLPVVAALLFFSLPFVHVFDEPGSGTALGILIGYYVMYAGPAWFVATSVSLVVDTRRWRCLRRSGASLSGKRSKSRHAFNAAFWLAFLPIFGFIAWFILAGFFR